MSPLLLALLTFGSLGLLVGGVAWLVQNWNAPMLARLRALTQPLGAAGGQVTVLTDDRPNSPVEKLLTKLGRGTAAVPDKDRDVPELVKNRDAAPDLAQTLVQAGIRRPNAMALLMGIRMALGGALLIGAALFFSVVNPTGTPLCFALGLLGYVADRKSVV